MVRDRRCVSIEPRRLSIRLEFLKSEKVSGREGSFAMHAAHVSEARSRRRRGGDCRGGRGPRRRGAHARAR